MHTDLAAKIPSSIVVPPIGYVHCTASDLGRRASTAQTDATGIERPHPDRAQLWRTLEQRRAVIAATTIAALTIAIIYLLVAPAWFSATALLLIDTKTNSIVRTPVAVDAAVESANIESQVEILKSERILQTVVIAQNMRDAPVLSPGIISTALGAFTSRLMVWRKTAENEKGPDPKVIAAARSLQRLINVRRVGTTYLIEVSASMASPTQASSVANSIVESYIADQQAFREKLSRRQSEMLQERSDELQNRVRIAEEAVEQLKFSGSVKGETSASARVALKNLESSAQTYRILHDKFLEQSAESWQQQYLTLPDATMASPAYPPLGKSSPKTLVVLASSLFFGFSAGVIITLLLDRKALGLTGRGLRT